MTISKKLLIITSIALGLQFNASAFATFDDNTFKNEQSQILTFAQDLKSNNSTHVQKIAQWLDQQAINPYSAEASKGKHSSNHRAIIDIITNDNLTEKSKITLLSELIAQQKSDARKRAAKSFVETICAGIAFTGLTAFCIWAIVEEHKNPSPRHYYVNTPGMSVSVRTTSWWPESCWPNSIWPNNRVTYTYNF